MLSSAVLTQTGAPASAAGAPRLLHAIPDFLQEGAGNWKDIASRLQLWPELGCPVDVVRFSPDDPASLVDQLGEASDVLIEYSWWPDLIAQLRRSRPQLRVHVRTHNAEAFQHLARSGWVCWPPLAAARNAYGFLRLAWIDSRCRRHSESLWGISPWDNRRYWRWLPGRGSVEDFPYYCPWPALRSEVHPLDWEARPRRVVSLPGVADRIGRAMLDGYVRFIRAVSQRPESADWQFRISRGLRDAPQLPTDCPLQFLPADMDPWPTLCQSRVLVVLGWRGYGMKTNIIDGLAAGCHVVVHATLFDRLPDELQRQCIRCDIGKSNPMIAVWERCMAPTQGGPALNQWLRNQALATARRLIGVSA